MKVIMKEKIKVALIMFMMGVFFANFTISSYAATGFEGYAIHRDGAFLNTTWHAGLMDEAHPKKTYRLRMRDNLIAL